ncbi:MAG: heme-binding protein [Enhydrobacter sp.]
MWQAISYYGVLVIESIVGVFGVRLYEEPRYEVIDRLGDRVEIRRYGPRLAAQVELPAAGEAGRSEAFQLLFAYIAGANRTAAAGRDRIAMTVPVEVHDKVAMTVPVQTSQVNGFVRMRFFLPAKFSRETAPAPVDQRVQIVTMSGETIAILRYSGGGNDRVQRQAALTAALAPSPWRPVGEPYTLNYDAPFTLPFLRRNEAAAAVERAP